LEEKEMIDKQKVMH